MYYSSNGQSVHVDKVERSEGPKLFNDAIGGWPNYKRLVGPAFQLTKRGKKYESISPVQQSYIPVSLLICDLSIVDTVF